MLDPSSGFLSNLLLAVPDRLIFTAGPPPGRIAYFAAIAATQAAFAGELESPEAIAARKFQRGALDPDAIPHGPQYKAPRSVADAIHEIDMEIASAGGLDAEDIKPLQTWGPVLQRFVDVSTVLCVLELLLVYVMLCISGCFIEPVVQIADCRCRQGSRSTRPRLSRQAASWHPCRKHSCNAFYAPCASVHLGADRRIQSRLRS